MKIIVALFILLINSISIASNYSSIDYDLYYVDDAPKPYIRVETNITGSIKDNVIIDLPYKWANGYYVEQIKNFKLITKDLEFKIKKSDDHQILISNKQINKLSYSYEIHQKDGDLSDIYIPIIRNDLVHAVGYGLFSLPEDLNNKTNVKIKWHNIPKDWQFLSDHGKGAELNFTIDDSTALLHAVYIAGKTRTHEIETKNKPVTLSLYGKFKLSDAAIKDDLKHIIKTEQDFFKDYNFNDYLISIIEGNEPNAIGGTRLHNSFIAYMSDDLEHERYYILFAHEYFHNWLGGKISNDSEKAALNYWWSEGFTDYYARVLSYRSGGISLAEFTDSCNELLYEYYFSAVINEPNTRILKDFWHDHDVQKLPYYRGFSFALYLNQLIKANDATKSLDDVMLDLFALARQDKIAFSPELFNKLVKKYMPKGIEQEIIDYIDAGETIDLTALTKILPLEKMQLGHYERGFNKDIDLSKSDSVKNIDTNSNAYKSGLRVGDKILSIDMHPDPKKVATITTDKGEFKFRPESQNKKTVYQFKTNLAAQEQEKMAKFFGLK